MRKNKCIVIILLILFLINVLCIYIYAQDITDLQEQSNNLTEELNSANNILKAVQDEISENMQQLQDLDVKIAESQEELNQIDIEVGDLEKQIEENQTKLADIEKRYENLRNVYKNRLVAIYKKPQLQYLDTLLNSKNMIEFISNYYSIKQLIKFDKKIIEDVKQQKNEIETTKNILAEKKNQIVVAKQNQIKQAQVLSNTKTTREYYISKLSNEEKELQQKIDTYNNQVAELEAEIKLLAANSISEDYIGGAIKWPVPGYSTITSQYGMRVHPITGAYKLHTGVDIGAPMGSSFVAAANGIVTKATYNFAYGNMVIIDHGGGVQTLYAHGSEIMVQLGQSVSAGTEVLKVGSTGYSTGPHAHFEIRINGQTINPLNILLDQNTNNNENTENTND